MTIREWLRARMQSSFNLNTCAAIQNCPSCGVPMSDSTTPDEAIAHNSETCRLVNLVLGELGVSFAHMLRVEIYYGTGPLRGFYFTADPYTIHISEGAYL
ncbi:MAG TPA: hypothetical protein VLV18_09155, partial [Terriglobales bacterium]|nr:hypothetical protein [Terriglobales bacterium]